MVGPVPQSRIRIRAFVDFWNLQITMNEREAAANGLQVARFEFDWQKFPAWLCTKAANIGGISGFSFEGVNVYASYNPGSPTDRTFKNWVLNWLNRQPGLQVDLRERQVKRPPRCPTCRYEISSCPSCQQAITATAEKGVDTAIATDMIRLAWENAYDVAILVSSDSDLVPAVKFLDMRGLRIIQAGFPPMGVELATSCWASFDLFSPRNEFRRDRGPVQR